MRNLSAQGLGESRKMIRILLCCLALLTSIALMGCSKEDKTPEDNEIIKNAGKVPANTGPAPKNSRPAMAPPGV
jgi:hypothetical protein